MAIIEEPLVQAIERLRAQHNDDADYEAKSCATTLSKRVWESVSAFANTDGGTLLLGVDENENFTVPPQFDADKTINQFVDGMGDGSKDGAKVVSPPRIRFIEIRSTARRWCLYRCTRTMPRTNLVT